MDKKQLFDDWPDRYDRWFETPVGKAVLRYELDLILALLRLGRGDSLLDAGSGTGIFTRAFLDRAADVMGIDISLAMLRRAMDKGEIPGGRGVVADMSRLPFADGIFDKTVSVAALEFITDEKRAVAELFRVTRPGGVVVVATLNSLSPWAVRRRAKARRDPESIFNRVFFRSPEQLLASAPFGGMVRTAVHFGEGDDPAELERIEREGQGRQSGAFVAARWVKP
jgi:ubiquinone/menaquinone biosynthesis C-methylase UbiE